LHCIALCGLVVEMPMHQSGGVVSNDNTKHLMPPWFIC